MSLDESVGGLSALVAVLLLFVIVTSVLRVVARKKQGVGIGIHDYLVVSALLCFLFLSILAIYGMARQFVAYPTPKDMKSLLTNGMFVSFIKVYFLLDLFSLLTLGCVRLSALFFYRRIFVVSATRKSVFNIVTMTGVVVVSCWTLAFVLFQIFMCGSNFSWQFDPINGTKCLTYPYLEGAGISSFILDILVLFMPIPKIWTLHTSTARKAAISCVFLSALIGVAASCARVVFFVQNANRGRAANETDVFLNNTRSMYYIIMEAGFCLTAVNLPSLWYFFSGGRAERFMSSVRGLLSIRSNKTSSNLPNQTSVNRNFDEGSNKSISGVVLTQKYKVDLETPSPALSKRGEALELETWK